MPLLHCAEKPDILEEINDLTIPHQLPTFGEYTALEVLYAPYIAQYLKKKEGFIKKLQDYNENIQKICEKDYTDLKYNWGTIKALIKAYPKEFTPKMADIITEKAFELRKNFFIKKSSLETTLRALSPVKMLLATGIAMKISALGALYSPKTVTYLGPLASLCIGYELCGTLENITQSLNRKKACEERMNEIFTDMHNFCLSYLQNELDKKAFEENWIRRETSFLARLISFTYSMPQAFSEMSATLKTAAQPLIAQKSAVTFTYAPKITKQEQKAIIVRPKPIMTSKKTPFYSLPPFILPYLPGLFKQVEKK